MNLLFGFFFSLSLSLHYLFQILHSYSFVILCNSILFPFLLPFIFLLNSFHVISLDSITDIFTRVLIFLRLVIQVHFAHIFSVCSLTFLTLFNTVFKYWSIVYALRLLFISILYILYLKNKTVLSIFVKKYWKFLEANGF